VPDKAGDILAGLVMGVPTSRTLSRMEELQHRVGAAAVEISRLAAFARAALVIAPLDSAPSPTRTTGSSLTGVIGTTSTKGMASRQRSSPDPDGTIQMAAIASSSPSNNRKAPSRAATRDV
jgi:hypothetical protein